eukprot:744671-Lingulodinium_polyedra.AAC.1
MGCPCQDISIVWPARRARRVAELVGFRGYELVRRDGPLSHFHGERGERAQDARRLAAVV